MVGSSFNYNLESCLIYLIQQNVNFVELEEDDKPFEIPSSWKWITCGNLLSVISGTSYNKNFISNDGIIIIRGGNLVNQAIQEQADDVHLPIKEFYDRNKCINQFDIVVVASTGSITGIGRPAFVDFQPTKDLQIGAFLRIIRLYDKSLYPYMKQIFKSNYYKNWISKSVSGIGIRNLKEEHITNLLIPLPPLEEQERIVKVLNDLLPLCEVL